ncbi:(2Fe-2S) ferredoxin domain-containing protein [Niameybacter massiliensis]|uniref:(2Fe-2S) ferredoxin domain-containing protein n=1 Tax=Holtiella tumoricola TaxID=3018743 RepID=A0AA42DRI5_9FIRM|nr:(2Fe-2S) ferredoxin domain-containing protein [Holtiella tumoricola]MDA3733706.1 (2Fe-2S) ferredoxin domain-containing protein [Holtiella tumoricola]
MTKIMSLDQLKTLRDNVKNKVDLRVKGENVDNMVVVRVAMATCGIASGAREVMNYFAELVRDEKVDNVVITQSGCMGYCYAEPTIEVTLPGKEPVVYGNVDKAKAKEILEKHILGGEMVDGIIPTIHKSLDE